MSLSIKNKILTEKLEEADKTIIALMNKISEHNNTIFSLKHKLKQCEIISNNVLYFHDKSDYEISLYEILNILQDRDKFESRYDKLSYMEEE